MPRRLGRVTAIVATIIACWVTAVPARAEFPDRTIRMLYGFPPGGSGDILARVLADAMGTLLGQKIVVENKTGANGLLASEAAARAPADGHTVLLCSTGNMTIVTELPGMRLPINPATDLTAVVLVARTTYGLAVARSSPWRSVAEIIQAARAKPGTLTYANPGLGTVQHLASEYLKQRMDVDIVQVPYRGSGQAILDMMAGRTDIIITNLADMMGQIRSGDLRLLALGDPMGRRFFPEAPMIADEVPGFETNGWFALCAPPGLPDAAALHWQDAARRALEDEGVQRKLIENGLVATFQDAAGANRMMDQARRTYREIIRAANIRVD